MQLLLLEALPPSGFVYVPGFLTEAEQAALVARIQDVTFGDFEMRGQVAHRKVAHFGWRYQYDGTGLVPGPPLPDWLANLRDRSASHLQLDPARFEQGLINAYRPGAGIGWHRDAPQFGSRVIGLSLLAPARFRMRRQAQGKTVETFVQVLEPGSLYLLSGASRSVWQHAIPPVGATRYSITFRTLRATSPPRPAPPSDALPAPL